MDGHELGSVRKCPLDLDHGHQLRDARHDIVGRQDGRAEAYQLSHRLSLAGTFEDFIADDRHGFRIVQFEPSLATFPRQFGSRENREPFKFIEVKNIALLSW